MSVNKERVQLLVDALRSGEFKQGIDALRRHVDGEVRHCCLGVATEVALRNGFQPATHVDNLWEHAEQDLHPEVRDWYGFGSNNPMLNIEGCQYQRFTDVFMTHEHATELNDGGVPFDEIADGFERTFINEETEV